MNQKLLQDGLFSSSEHPNEYDEWIKFVKTRTIISSQFCVIFNPIIATPKNPAISKIARNYSAM